MMSKVRLYRAKKKKEVLRHRSGNGIHSAESLNYTLGAFLKHHTIDIMLPYCTPHISSIGSIDDRDSTSVAKMSDVFFWRVNQMDLQVDCKIKMNLHVTSRRHALKI